MDTTGLMAPAGSEARRRYDEAEARKRGFYGLMAAVAEPLSYIPGPVGDAAQIAQNIGEHGPAEGLMASWDAVGLPKVLRQGPKALSMIERAPTKLSKQAAAELAKDPLGGRAMQFFKDTGTHIDPAGNVRRTFSDIEASVTPTLAKELSRAIRGKQFTAISGESQDFFSHPELYNQYPSLAKMPVVVDWQPGKPSVAAQYRGPGAGAVEMANVSVQGSPQGWKYSPLSAWLHEMQHAVQTANDLPGGTSPRAIADMLFAELDKKAPGASLDPGLRETVKRLARSRYFSTLGEADARATQFLSRFPEDQLKKVNPVAAYRDEFNTPLRPASIVVDPYEQDWYRQIAKRLTDLQGP